MNDAHRRRLAVLLVFTFAWSAGGCATYRPVVVDNHPNIQGTSAEQLRPHAGDRVRITLNTGERLTGIVRSRTPIAIVIGGADRDELPEREVDIAAIASLEVAQRPLAASSFGGALGTVVLVGVIAVTILLAFDPPFGDS